MISAARLAGMNQSIPANTPAEFPLLTDVVQQKVDASALASLLKAAGDALRLDILRVLSQDSYGVLELSRLFDTKQSGMSHHLKVLANAGLLSSRREGNSIFYRRAYLSPEHSLANLQQQLFATVDEIHLSPDLQQKVEELRQERNQAAQTFFTENADKFRAQQDLIASYPVYADQVTSLLNNTLLKHKHLALEIGPGEGEFLTILSQQFNQVVALDNSTQMLEKAKQFAQSKSLRNIEFVLGNTQSPNVQKILADCIVVNMVLHHTASPADIFIDLSRSLAPGGALLICDLCRHEQTWAREACGDLWQGFEPQDFSRWAKAAKLDEGQSVYFALRNGFQIQLRQFFKPSL